ncbi:MAG: sn-glycerol-1-phosphate dehydrogenase [Opitutae bacterium]|nr:sn-glycerol-1-phosphate dehydrogenase [Opitutae bacterium]
MSSGATINTGIDKGASSPVSTTGGLRHLTPEKLSLQEALSSARETRALEIGAGQLGRVPEIFRRYFPGRRAVVIADPTTFRLAGQTVFAALQRDGLIQRDTFLFTDPALYAESRFVTQLEESLKVHDAIPVAVGSGTINDLTKLAAHRTGRPYLCVATAASMDGYTAFGASITHAGAKQTFNCPAPTAVVADIDIIRSAPPEMTASGFADLMAKITAGADWIFADALGAEPIDMRAWSIVQGGLRAALADPVGARAGDSVAISQLVEGLMLGGFAMQWSKTSRPASGAEHQFSHLWDMEHHVHQGAAPSHGFKVGIATLAVTAFYEQLMQLPLERLDMAQCCAKWPQPEAMEAQVRQLLGQTDFIGTAVTETRAKHVSPEDLRRQLERLRANWPDLRELLRAQLLPFAELQSRLQSVGAPTEPEQIGISRERLRLSFMRALHIRRRFTVLDVALRTDSLTRCLDGLFGPGGRWQVAATGTR